MMDQPLIFGLTAYQLIAQALGIVGAAFYIGSYQIKSNVKLFIVQNIADIIFIVQFYMLGGMSGSLCTFVCLIRNCLLIKYDDWKWVQWKGWPYVFAVILTACSAITWDGFICIFPLVACIANTFGYWTNNARYIRIASGFVCSPAWLVYDVCIRSLGGFINDSLTIISVVVSIIRFGWKNLGNDDFGK